MQSFLENLNEAQEIIRRTDHMIYVTYPLVKDKNLLLKVLLETHNALKKCINCILQHDYLYKKIKLTRIPANNMKIFRIRCAPRFGISDQQVLKILELFDIIEKHKNSPFEFKKDEKIVILSDNAPPKILELDHIKAFVALSKDILEKIQKNLKGHL